MTQFGSARAGETLVASLPLETQLYLKQQDVLRLTQKLKSELNQRQKAQKRLKQIESSLMTMEHLILTDPLRAVEAVRKLKE